jgi:RNA polymerase sigma-70 factor (ECF subfamily)
MLSLHYSKGLGSAHAGRERAAPYLIQLNFNSMNEMNVEGLSPEQFNIQFQSAYNDHGKKLRYYAKTFTNSTQDAEDIVATLFADLWAKGEVFNRDKLKWSYLQKAVHNACVDHLKRKNRFESFGSATPDAANTIPSHEEAVIHTEVVAQIGELIDQLPPQTRRIIRKLYYDGMEPGEAADDMRLALSTIYNSRRSGFGQLVALLRRRNIRLWLGATVVFWGTCRN